MQSLRFDTFNILCIFYIFTIFCILVLIFFTESLFKIMEDYRAKPSSWYAVGWMPIVDEEKSLRPGSGYDSAAARNMRIHQECWRHFLKKGISLTQKTPASSFMAMERHDRPAIQLELSWVISRYILVIYMLTY